MANETGYGIYVKADFTYHATIVTRTGLVLTETGVGRFDYHGVSFQIMGRGTGSNNMWLTPQTLESSPIV